MWNKDVSCYRNNSILKHRVPPGPIQQLHTYKHSVPPDPIQQLHTYIHRVPPDPIQQLHTYIHPFSAIQPEFQYTKRLS